MLVCIRACMYVYVFFLSHRNLSSQLFKYYSHMYPVYLEEHQTETSCLYKLIFVSQQHWTLVVINFKQ